MVDAYIIEIGGETIGVAARETTAFRFYATHRAFFPLEGRSFESPEHVQLAALALRRANARPARTGTADSPRVDRSHP
ncbi:MAG: hypothetical protein ABSC22_05485 [Roseiarcus sp.]